MRKPEKRILLIGCGGSAGYNFVDALRISGERFVVVGTDINREHLELSNCDVRYLVPRNSDPKYIDAINAIIKKERIDFVHVQPDPEVAFWSKNRARIAAPLWLPSEEAIELCHDKILFNEAMRKSGVPVPESYAVTDEKSIAVLFKKLKKRGEKVWVRAIRGAGSRAALPVANVTHATVWIDYWNTMRGTESSDFMLAEFLPGREFAFQSVWKDGRLITSQARERKEYVFGNLMPSGQSSSPSVAVTVNDERVNKVATAAVLAVDKKASGIFCVDLKENADGVPCVTEINIGRFFTTSDFFAAAGCNMPLLYLKLALGEQIPEVAQYNPLPAGLYWLRIIDMGKKLVRDGEWTYRKA